jgi:hypothetical protein
MSHPSMWHQKAVLVEIGVARVVPGVAVKGNDSATYKK